MTTMSSEYEPNPEFYPIISPGYPATSAYVTGVGATANPSYSHSLSPLRCNFTIMTHGLIVCV